MLFFVIALGCFLLQLFLPWWIIGPVALAAGYWQGRSMRYAFVSAFLAVFTVWVVVGLTATLPNGNILANRVGDMLKLPAGAFNWVLVLLISGILGGIAAGFCGTAGYYIHAAFSPKDLPKRKS